MAEQKKKPASTVGDGFVQVAIWRNSKKDNSGEFFNATVGNAYRDKSTGEIKGIDHFSGQDLLELSLVAADGYREWRRLTREYNRGRGRQNDASLQNGDAGSRDDTFPQNQLDYQGDSGGAYDRGSASYENGQDAGYDRQQSRPRDQRRPNPR